MSYIGDAFSKARRFTELANNVYHSHFVYTHCNERAFVRSPLEYIYTRKVYIFQSAERFDCENEINWRNDNQFN